MDLYSRNNRTDYLFYVDPTHHPLGIAKHAKGMHDFVLMFCFVLLEDRTS